MKYTYFDNVQIKQMGLRIKTARKSKKMTQSQLADILGITIDQVSNIELGKSACKTDHIFLLTQVFNISADYLLNGTNQIACEIISDEQIMFLTTKLNNRKKTIIRELLTYIK